MSNEVLNQVVFNKAKDIKVEYITSDNKKSIGDLCKNYNAPFSVISDIAKQENWDRERETYHAAILNDIQKQISGIRVKSELNTLSRGITLQKRIYDKILDDIDKGLYAPTVKDFVEITKVINGKSETDNSVNVNNNKILHVHLKKPIEEMTYEELIDVEREMSEQSSEEF